jgi:hypothetical protein
MEVIWHEAICQEPETRIAGSVFQHLAVSVDLSGVGEHRVLLIGSHADAKRGRATVEVTFQAVSLPPPGLPCSAVLQDCSASGDLKVAAT